MSTLSGTSNAQFFYPCLKSCAQHRDTEIITLLQNMTEQVLYRFVDGRAGWMLRVRTSRS